MIEDGYVKYSSQWIKEGPLPYEHIESLNRYRQKLYDLGLIGAYKNGIGFGNISQRWRDDWFIISGSATGNLHELTRDHYTVVTDFDISYNRLICKGPIQASSESMSHGVIYRQDRSINAVIHVHSVKLWGALLYKIPTTGKEITYGTPEMAIEIVRLFQESDVVYKKAFVMAGHQDGIFTFGQDLEEAMVVLLNINSPLL